MEEPTILPSPVKEFEARIDPVYLLTAIVKHIKDEGFGEVEIELGKGGGDGLFVFVGI